MHSIDLNRVASLILTLGQESFVAGLLDFLKSEVVFDSSIILAYPGQGKLEIIHQALHKRDLEIFDETYREGLWAMSPLYLSACAGFRGPFHIQDLAREDFRKSRFYQRYWRHAAISDQFAYIAQRDNGSPIILSMERSTTLPPYSTREIARLRDLAGLVSALIEKNWSLSRERGAFSQIPVKASPTSVNDILDEWQLTPREKEVVEGMLLGHSNKVIARQLGISDQTVKVHCKNINSKLGLSGRAEVHARVLKALLG